MINQGIRVFDDFHPVHTHGSYVLLLGCPLSLGGVPWILPDMATSCIMPCMLQAVPIVQLA